jgi:hypothetical protein
MEYISKMVKKIKSIVVIILIIVIIGIEFFGEEETETKTKEYKEPSKVSELCTLPTVSKIDRIDFYCGGSKKEIYNQEIINNILNQINNISIRSIASNESVPRTETYEYRMELVLSDKSWNIVFYPNNYIGLGAYGIQKSDEDIIGYAERLYSSIP